MVLTVATASEDTTLASITKLKLNFSYFVVFEHSRAIHTKHSNHLQNVCTLHFLLSTIHVLCESTICESPYYCEKFICNFDS